MESVAHKLDARAIVTLIVFFVVNALVIFPLRIPLPAGLTRTLRSKCSRAPQSFTIGLESAPVIGVLLLLASTCISGKVVRDGIVGSGGVRPYDIMTLFLSFAYISVSLDCTGLFRYLAFWVAAKSGESGRALYTYFYLFFAVFGTVVGNDPIILSGTPFLVYFTRHINLQPATAFLFTQFQVANLVSALLVSSNPTNLVLTSAFHISFLSYSAWLALPVVAGVICLYPILAFGMFRKEGMIPKKLDPPKVDPWSAFVDPAGGIFGAVLFAVTIVALVALSAVGLLEGTEGVWTVTAPAACVMLARDVTHDLIQHYKYADPPGSPKPAAIELNALPRSTKLRQRTESGLSATGDIPLAPLQNETSHDNSGAVLPSSSLPAATLPPQTKKPNTLQRLLPTPYLVISRLPWALLPFAFSMFILVEGLQENGWINIFGRWWAAWVDVSGVAGSVALMGLISVLGCNVFGTNIGATILLSRVLQQWEAAAVTPSPRALYGAVFALAVGSNFGAYSFVFSASLAGLFWRDILKQKSVIIARLEFIKWNTIPVIITTIVSCLVVAGEVCVMYKS